eukprot:319459_1
MFHYLIFIWYTVSTTSANNFSDLNQDELSHAMDFLSQPDQSRFQKINKKCSSCYNTFNQQIKNVKELNHIIKNLQSIELNDTIKQNILRIHNESRTDELFIANMPNFLIKLSQFSSPEQFEIMKTLLKLNPIDQSYDFGNDVHWSIQFLIRASKNILSGIWNSSVMRDVNALLYEHCFEFVNYALKIDNKTQWVTRMEAIYDPTLGIAQEHMDYIYSLMDEYGFVVWHRNQIDQK